MDVYEALAHPDRRALLGLLEAGERSVLDLAEHFDSTRPAVSRHLRVLRQAGLVSVREDGTRRLYSIDAAPLREVDQWLARYRGMWSQRLDALETQVKRARKAGR